MRKIPQVGEVWKYEEGFHYLILAVDYPDHYGVNVQLLHLETGRYEKDYVWPETSVYWHRVA